MENHFEDTENNLRELAKRSNRTYFKCETIEEAKQILDDPNVKSGDIISFIADMNGKPTIFYGSVSTPVVDEIVHHVVIVSNPHHVGDIVNNILESSTLSTIETLESKMSRMPTIEDFHDVSESRYVEDNRKWYDRYDKRGRKKVRKYT